MSHDQAISNFGLALNYHTDWQLLSLLQFASDAYKLLAPDENRSPALTRLIRNFQEAAVAFYQKGLELLNESEENTPYERQLLIWKVQREWDRLAGLLASSHFLPMDDPKARAMTQVIEWAWDSVFLVPEARENRNIVILPQVDRQFRLLRFRYAPNLVSIEMPIGTLYAPWEWSTLYHEVAGLWIQTDHAQNLLQEISPAITDWSAWLEPFGEIDANYRSFIQHNWLEEFLEDTISVLCIGSALSDNFDTILSHYYPEPISTDPRHPHRELRAGLAQALNSLRLNENITVEDAQLVALAEAIFEKREQIVVPEQIFSEEDHDQVKVLTEDIAYYGKGRPDTFSAPVWIAALMETYYNELPDNVGIISKLLSNLEIHLKPAPTSELMAGSGGGFTSQLDFIENLQRADLDSFQFSVVDPFAGTCDLPNGTNLPLAWTTIVLDVPSGFGRTTLTIDALVVTTIDNADYPNGTNLPLRRLSSVDAFVVC